MSFISLASFRLREVSAYRIVTCLVALRINSPTRARAIYIRNLLNDRRFRASSAFANLCLRSPSSSSSFTAMMDARFARSPRETLTARLSRRGDWSRGHESGEVKNAREAGSRDSAFPRTRSAERRRCDRVVSNLRFNARGWKPTAARAQGAPFYRPSAPLILARSAWRHARRSVGIRLTVRSDDFAGVTKERCTRDRRNKACTVRARFPVAPLMIRLRGSRCCWPLPLPHVRRLFTNLSNVKWLSIETKPREISISSEF